MIPDDWLEYIQDKSRELARPANPPKRRQPRITRMQSPRMRRVSGQTSNTIRAIYGTESAHSATPTKPNEWRGTHEVGPGDEHNDDYKTGKATESRG
jgi:hypothetical protein